MNRGVSGDIVVVELLPEAEWKGEGDEVVDDDKKDEDPEEGGSDDEEGDKIAVDEPKKKTQPTGRVVGVLKRNWRTYVCHLALASLPPSALTSAIATPILATPVSRALPKIKLLTRQASLLATQKFLVSIDTWSADSRLPEGHFVRSLGEVGSKEGELASLLEEFEVPYRPFSGAILSCLPEEGEKWVVPSKDDDPKGVWKGREDFRDEIICSIDPPGKALKLLFKKVGADKRYFRRLPRY
jgi:exosome complex exonuclease DIS3/RRP44